MKRQGYILVLHLLIVSISVVLVSLVVQKALAYRQFSAIAADREKAKMLAYGVFEWVLDMLIFKPAEQEKKAETPEEKAGERDKEKWLMRLLSFVNTWHEWKYTEEKDGVDGICQAFVSCEQGKIAINSIYNGTKKKWEKTDKIDGEKIGAL